MIDLISLAAYLCIGLAVPVLSRTLHSRAMPDVQLSTIANTTLDNSLGNYLSVRSDHMLWPFAPSQVVGDFKTRALDILERKYLTSFRDRAFREPQLIRFITTDALNRGDPRYILEGPLPIQIQYKWFGTYDMFGRPLSKPHKKDCWHGIGLRATIQGMTSSGVEAKSATYMDKWLITDASEVALEYTWDWNSETVPFSFPELWEITKKAGFTDQSYARAILTIMPTSIDLDHKPYWFVEFLNPLGVSQDKLLVDMQEKRVVRHGNIPSPTIPPFTDHILPSWNATY